MGIHHFLEIMNDHSRSVSVRTAEMWVQIWRQLWCLYSDCELRILFSVRFPYTNATYETYGNLRMSPATERSLVLTMNSVTKQF